MLLAHLVAILDCLDTLHVPQTFGRAKNALKHVPRDQRMQQTDQQVTVTPKLTRSTLKRNKNVPKNAFFSLVLLQSLVKLAHFSA